MAQVGVISGSNNPINIKDLKAKINKKANQKEDKEIYKTNAGLKIGAAVASIPAAGSIFNLCRLKRPSACVAPLLTAGLFVANGAIVDQITNNKYEKFEKKTEGLSKKEVLKGDFSAELTDNNEVYYKSNNGKKYGALAGAVTLPIVASSYLTNLNSKFKAGVLAVCGMIGATSGLALGAIQDNFVNKGAKKHVDIQNLK